MKIWLPEIQVDAEATSWTEDGLEDFELYLNGTRLNVIEDHLSNQDRDHVARQIEAEVKRKNEESYTDHVISMRAMG